jgi:hypothetical protein
MPSIAVKMPTNEVIPSEIIKAVRMVLNKLLFIDLKPSKTFSFKFILVT